MPSCIVNHGGRKYLFYIGWNQGVTVSYRNSVGLAVSTNGGLDFERVFEGPIIDRSRLEPYFCASPFAIFDDGKWKLWYASVTDFLVVNGKPEPVYQVKYAESADGHEWVRPNVACLDYLFEGEANARPCVIKEERTIGCGTVSWQRQLSNGQGAKLPESAMRSRRMVFAGAGWTIWSASTDRTRAGFPDDRISVRLRAPRRKIHAL